MAGQGNYVLWGDNSVIVIFEIENLLGGIYSRRDTKRKSMNLKIH